MLSREGIWGAGNKNQTSRLFGTDCQNLSNLADKFVFNALLDPSHEFMTKTSRVLDWLPNEQKNDGLAKTGRDVEQQKLGTVWEELKLSRLARMSQRTLI